jgi:hypothetical protein
MRPSFGGMKRALLSAAALLSALAGPALAQPARSVPAVFVEYFYAWKAQPRALKVSDLKLLDAGGRLRVLCGLYDLPGQAQTPFLVFGDDAPSASAAWEPGSFPATDPQYQQVMRNLRLCETGGEKVTRAIWDGAVPAR